MPQPSPRPRWSVRGVIDAALWVGTIGILGLCLLTLVAFAGDTHSLPEVTTHFRVHYAAGLFLSVIVYAAVRRFRWAAVFAVFALLNAATLAPRFIPREAAPEGAPELKLLLSNVLTSNRDHASLLTLVAREKPDLIALLEVNDRWVTALGPLSAEYAYSRRDSRPDNFGIALFSRLPLTEVKTIYLGPAEVPSIRATLTFGGRPITVLATHPVPPGNPENLFLRDQHLTAIARWSSASPTPALVIGDLNCTPWSPAFGRLLKDGALLDTGRGLTPTWPVKPWWLRIPLDHCLASPSFLVADHHRGPDIGSDHFPIIVTLTLRP